MFLSQGHSLGAAPEKSTSKIIEIGCHFMYLRDGGKSGMDPHADSAALSAPGEDMPPAAPSMSTISSAGSSMAPPPIEAVPHGVVPQPDPDDAGTGSSPVVDPASNDLTSEILIPGSSTIETSALASTATASHRHTTQLQRGISKPKLYGGVCKPLLLMNQ